MSSDSPSTPKQQEEARPQRQLLSAEAGVWERFKVPTFDKVRLLERSVSALQAGTLSEDARHQAVQAAQRLASSMGTFGFPHGSQLARQILTLLHPGGPLSTAQISRLSALVTEVRQELEHSSTDSEGGPAGLGRLQPRLLVVDNNSTRRMGAPAGTKPCGA